MDSSNGSLEYTPIQRAILGVLADGLSHSMEELRACLGDELASSSSVRWHLTNLRKKLRPKGQDILCEWVNRRPKYRQVRLLASAYTGKR